MAIYPYINFDARSMALNDTEKRRTTLSKPKFKDAIFVPGGENHFDDFGG